MTFSKTKQKLVFSLPMRDGNYTILIGDEQYKTCFQSSYEGWKPPTPVDGGVGLACFQSSYEGWKHITSFQKMSDISVFSLPMRDGNQPFLRSLSWEENGFQSSYEGWKPRAWTFTVGVKDSFQSSYEGWKLQAIMEAIGAEWGFQSSYEGWKHIFIDGDEHRTYPVFSLPMRDGNFTKQNAITRQYQRFLVFL